MSTAAHKTMAQRMLDRAWQARHPAGADESSSPQGGEARLAGGEEFPEDFKESPGQTYIRLPGAGFNDALADLYPVAIRCLHTDPAGLW